MIGNTILYIPKKQIVLHDVNVNTSYVDTYTSSYSSLRHYPISKNVTGHFTMMVSGAVVNYNANAQFRPERRYMTEYHADLMYSILENILLASIRGVIYTDWWGESFEREAYYGQDSFL